LEPNLNLLEEKAMYHYDPETALVELDEEALLPNPVRLRDMMFRTHLATDDSILINRQLQDYLKSFGEAQKKGREVLQQLTQVAKSMK
jgi:hypothetical protein